MGNQTGKSLRVHPVAHLVVILREHYQLAGADVTGRVAVTPAAVAGVLARVDEPVTVRAGQLLEGTEIGVIAGRLSGQQCVESVVEVIVPLGVEPVPTLLP